MLRELRIRDIAIIDDLTLAFGDGLNVITGETGAGKSIIVQALALLCGARGAADVVRADADEAIVEGLFECRLPADLREALGLEDADEIMVRRQVGRTGKGRILINGSPATLPLLARLGEYLVHIYGQHEQATLLRPASHLELLDRFGELGGTREHMAAAYARYAAARRRRDELATRTAVLQERRELLEFQRRELADAAPSAGEDAALRNERERLRHSERLQDVCRDGETGLYAAPGAAVDTAARLHQRLLELVPIAPSLAAIAELVESGRVQLEEAALMLRAAASHLQADPARLEAVEERLALLQRLARKFSIAADALPDTLTAIEGDLASLASHAGNASAAEAELGGLRDEALALATALSRARVKAAKRLTARMTAELAALGMQGAGLQVAHAIGDDAELSADGIDRIEFLLGANPGEPAKPLARVASGGELSRIMLALKALTASAGETPILLFDEVDAGIGGTVADAVARRLTLLARNRQLLCVTHLAQIAAYADHHIAVEKLQVEGRTVTRAHTLAGTERVAELSRMLGGSQAPTEAERYARRLIAEARRVRGEAKSQP